MKQVSVLSSRDVTEATVIQILLTVHAVWNASIRQFYIYQHRLFSVWIAILQEQSQATQPSDNGTTRSET